MGGSSVTGKPIPDIHTIGEKNSNGNTVAFWGVTTRWGKVTLSGGKARFDRHTSSGDLYYYEEKQGRVITLKPDCGGWDAQVRPLK